VSPTRALGIGPSEICAEVFVAGLASQDSRGLCGACSPGRNLADVGLRGGLGFTRFVSGWLLRLVSEILEIRGCAHGGASLHKIRVVVAMLVAPGEILRM
jgi:hypothetical protein